MCFNSGTNLWPTSGVDPDPAIFYLELCDRWIFDKFWHSRRARFPFFPAVAGNQFCKTRGDERRGVGFAVAFDRRTQELRYAMQDFHGAIFGVAAETNHCGDVYLELPKCLCQTVRRPELFLARNAGA